MDSTLHLVKSFHDFQFFTLSPAAIYDKRRRICQEVSSKDIETSPTDRSEETHTPIPSYEACVEMKGGVRSRHQSPDSERQPGATSPSTTINVDDAGSASVNPNHDKSKRF